VGSLLNEDKLTLADLSRLENLEKFVGRRGDHKFRISADKTMALNDMALLSVVYERWAAGEGQGGEKEGRCMEVRQRMLECVAPGTAEEGDVNMMIGDFWVNDDDVHSAIGHYKKAVAAYDKAGCTGNLVGAWQAIGEVQKDNDNPDEASESFTNARALLDDKEEPERCAELELYITECFLESEGLKNPDTQRVLYLEQGVEMYNRAIGTAQRAGKSKKALDVIARIRNALGQLYYRMQEYDKAKENWGEAVALNKKLYGSDTTEVADLLLNLGLTELFQAKDLKGQSEPGDATWKVAMVQLDDAAELFSTALKVYDKKLSGRDRVERCQMVHTQYLRPVWEQREKRANAKKCELHALEYQMSEDHPEYVRKLSEVAVEAAREAIEDPSSATCKEAVEWLERALRWCRDVLVDEDSREQRLEEMLQKVRGVDTAA